MATPYDTIAISGGFDPIHIGHVRMIQEAATYGNLTVILNSDEWLIRKKGYKFMPFEERKEILYAIKGVTKVVMANDSDGSVCNTLAEIKPNYFANGGDRVKTNTPEVMLCNELNIQMLWNVGGEKIQSSSELTKNYPVTALRSTS